MGDEESASSMFQSHDFLRAGTAPGAYCLHQITQTDAEKTLVRRSVAAGGGGKQKLISGNQTHRPKAASEVCDIAGSTSDAGGSHSDSGRQCHDALQLAHATRISG